jgi:hypothetical protein
MIPRVGARSLVLVASVACAAVALASTADCGGVTAQTAGADSGADATAGHDASDATSSADAGPVGDASTDAFGCGFACDSGHVPLGPCPASPPASGSSCTAAGEVCEYGSSWFMECNVVVQCQAGQWLVQSDGTGCAWLDGGGACPATWDEASSVDATPGTCPFASCVYPQGFCGCGVTCGGGGARGPRRMDLAGIFVCLEAGAACPEPRPLSGTPCEGDAGCMYGWGCGCGQSEQCVDGIWQARRIPPCP